MFFNDVVSAPTVEYSCLLLLLVVILVPVPGAILQNAYTKAQEPHHGSAQRSHLNSSLVRLLTTVCVPEARTGHVELEFVLGVKSTSLHTSV